MDKKELQKKLLEQQLEVIKDIKSKIATSYTMADIDESDVIDPEDFSHQAESNEMKTIFEQKLKKAEADLSILDKMDFSTKETIEPGAIIATEKFNFFIGLAMIPFEFDTKMIVGISEESPIYKVMEGKKAGDTFSYSDNTYIILNIQ